MPNNVPIWGEELSGIFVLMSPYFLVFGLLVWEDGAMATVFEAECAITAAAEDITGYLWRRRSGRANVPGECNP